MEVVINHEKKELSSLSFKSIYETFDHQLKLMDSKCKFEANPAEHMFATSCLIFFGPQTRTPTLDSFCSNSIPKNIHKIFEYKI